MRKRLVALVGLTASVAVVPSGAGAVAPDRHVLHYVETFRTSDICGFATSFEWIGTGYGTVYLDGGGDFVRQTDRIRETLTVTNIETGATISGHNAYQLMGTGERLVRAGLWFHLSGRGQGVVLRDVGRIVVSAEGDVTFVVGQHQWVARETKALCDALART